MRIISIIFLTIEFLYALASVNELDCEYGISVDVVLGETYRCDIQNNLNIKSRHSTEINKEVGLHQDGKSNDHVTGIFVQNKKIKYFPKGIENVFRNIKRIGIENSVLSELTQEDMKSYPKLVELNLMTNSLDILEDGTFDYNSKLVYIDLSNNNIAIIESKVFNNLIHLKYLKLYNNICIKFGAVNNYSGVKIVIERANEKCIDLELQGLKKLLDNLEQENKLLKKHDFLAFKTKIDDFKHQFQNSNFSDLSSVKQRLEKLPDWKDHAIWVLEEKNLFMVIIMGVCEVIQTIIVIVSFKNLF